MLRYVALVIGLAITASCQGQSKSQAQPAAGPTAASHEPKQLFYLPEKQQQYPAEIPFTLLEPQFQQIPAFNIIPDKEPYPRVQTQVLLYPGGAAPGQPFLLQPGGPPGNFLIPQPQPGPNVIIRDLPRGPPFVAGYPKPAHIPPIEKDAEEVPTNPANIPPFPSTPKKKPEKLETFDEQDAPTEKEAGEAPGLAGGDRYPQPPLLKPTINNLRPGQRFFVLNGIPLFSNYPFAPNNPEFNLKYAQPNALPVIPQQDPNVRFQNLPVIPQHLDINGRYQNILPQQQELNAKFQKFPAFPPQEVNGKFQNPPEFSQTRPLQTSFHLPLQNSLYKNALSGQSQGPIALDGFSEREPVFDQKSAQNLISLSQPEGSRQETVFKTSVPFSIDNKNGDQGKVQLKFDNKDFKLQPFKLYSPASLESGYFQYQADGSQDDEAVVIEAATGREDSSGRSTTEGENSPAAGGEQSSSEPSISQAHPGAIALAGRGGVAAAGPRGTALVGPGGLAVSSPQATAVAGPKKDQNKDTEDRKPASDRSRKGRRQ